MVQDIGNPLRIDPDLLEKYESVPQDDNYYYFYKYVRLDDQVLDGIFGKNQLKYTNPIDFNDPFDCHFAINIDFTGFTQANASKVFKQRIKGKKWLEVKEKLKARIRQTMSLDFRENFRRTVAVTCFNTDPFNMLMWSHYAYNHTGFILEFKISKFSSSTPYPLPVLYNDEYPSFLLNWDINEHLKKENIDSELTQLTILTKAECWSYEKEFRLLIDTTIPENIDEVIPQYRIILKKYDPLILSSVITGSKMNSENYKKVLEAVKKFNSKHNLNVQVHKAELADKKFKIVIPSHPRLSKEQNN